MHGTIQEGLVSTIIPVYNRADVLVEAVDSVLAQTYRPIEIIVVDDGSTDDTASVVAELAKNHPDSLKTVRTANEGPGAARERGRKMARGEFIQYLDSDDLLLPRKFEWQVAGLRSNSDFDVSYGKTRNYRHGEPPDNLPCRRTGEYLERMFPSLLESRWWTTATPLFRREATDRAGPWTTLWNEEDWEYDCRVASLGGKLHFCSEFIADKREGREDQLCLEGSVSKRKLADRAQAHRLILQHALNYGVGRDTRELQHFARELFLLSRQCGAVGLLEESRMLFALSREASEPVRRDGYDFKLYSLGARMIGWKHVAKWCAMADAIRKR